MEVRELQKNVVDLFEAWDKKRNVTYDEQLAFTHLVEEVGELASQYVDQKARKDRYSDAEVENAIGDILLQTIRLADLRGLDIEKVLMKIVEDDQKKLKMG